ncbi:hypothetical protein [Sphingobium sp. Sx8-8]|uniref:hypothetical protein n=1 Tax=Sphingobium sp. Sx8-8 TaxID=2933617 RepID=UPI001F582188|nr:hypothetical protein [Sphingobium sp. Sx8-8]
MLERLGVACAINGHIAQGMRAENGIVLMNEREKALNMAQSFLAVATRIVDQTALKVDNVKALERDVTRNPGGKTRAIEAAPSPSKDKPDLPVPEIGPQFHLEQAGFPARIFLCPQNEYGSAI